MILLLLFLYVFGTGFVCIKIEMIILITDKLHIKNKHLYCINIARVNAINNSVIFFVWICTFKFILTSIRLHAPVLTLLKKKLKMNETMTSPHHIFIYLSS